jgi:hypothetical protein
MNRKLSKTIFFLIAIFCFSITASAQKTNDKKGERNPPVIIPDKERKPKEKDKEKDKKPKTVFIYILEKVKN